MSNDEAELINNALKEEVPHMEPSSISDVVLILGLRDTNKGKNFWMNTAVVRELTGADEEYLSVVERKDDLTYGQYLSEVVARGTVSIGDRQVNNDPSVIDELSLFDRDILLLALVRATYGEEREVVVSCPKCDHSNDVTIELLKDFPVTQPDFDIESGLSVETSKGEVLLGFPKVGGVIPTDNMSIPEINTDMLAKCVIMPDNVSMEERLAWARGLGIKDRRKLTDALLSVEVGPRLREVNTQCVSCGEDMPILLDWVSLLLS